MTTTITGATGVDNIKAATGAVLQITQGLTQTSVTISATTHSDTGLSASITPTSSSSKILVTVNQRLGISNEARSMGADIKLLRGSTTILNDGNDSGYGSVYRDINISGITNIDTTSTVAFSYIDSPSTTSATTYKTTGRSHNGGNVKFQAYGAASVITLMEIAG
jgi:hypothetical protein|tara:strand:- start:58 stop:552 length:495 start_codon:yes stop_codon:yes gene_type:complete